MKVYPLSQAADPPAAVFTDAKDVLFDSTIRYDASFFEGLNRIVQSEPWLQRDRAMIDQLRSLGIENHLSHDEPADADSRANWLPAPEGQFALIVRAYVPTEPILDGSYKLPNVERTTGVR